MDCASKKPAIRGAEKNSTKYATIETPKLKYNADEKSRLSASFFWISAEPKPVNVMAVAMPMNMFTRDNMPYVSGPSNLANMIETTKLTI
ncbi:hypothetical protein SDC9_124156 [bioreactor metagenome]|uniref:Uncharacterized protein n=1 Tax=bioreactor metagenome TaxID=1076179 RepID=A0A645CJN0_9ZZZZ